MQILDITSTFIVLKAIKLIKTHLLSHFQDIYLVSEDKRKSFKVKILNIDNEKELLFFCGTPEKVIVPEFRKNARTDFSSLETKPRLDAKLTNGNHYISKARLNNFSDNGCCISVLKKFSSFLTINDSVDIQKTEKEHSSILGLFRIVYFIPEDSNSLFLKIGLEKIR